MTLILSAVTNGCVIHASDRQVSKRRTHSSPYEYHDRHSNKTIIVVAQDCWLVISYANLAYLDGKPTDQFIAEAISLQQLGSGGVHFGDFRDKGLHYMEVRRRIVDAMIEAYSRLDRNHRDVTTTVVIAGIQLTTPRHRNILFEFSIRDGICTPSMGKPDQNLLTRGWQGVNAGSEEPAVLEAVARTVARLNTPHPGSTVYDFRNILMDGIQDAAMQSAVVGDDVMGVILDPRERFGQTYFRPGNVIRQAEITQISTDHNIYDMRSISTPYILMLGGIVEPSVVSGTMTFGDNRCRIEVSGFQPEGPGSVIYLGGQHREQKPS